LEKSMPAPAIHITAVRPDRGGWSAIEAVRIGVPATHPSCRRFSSAADGLDQEVTLRCGGLGPAIPPEPLREWALGCFTLWDEGIDCAVLPNWLERASARIVGCRPEWCALPDQPRAPYFHLVSLHRTSATDVGTGRG
jgi:hypothetical protein